MEHPQIEHWSWVETQQACDRARNNSDWPTCFDLLEAHRREVPPHMFKAGEFHWYLGCIHDEMGDFRKAIWAHLQAARIQEARPSAALPTAIILCSLGNSLNHIGKPQLARMIYSKAVGIPLPDPSPENAQAQLNRILLDELESKRAMVREARKKRERDQEDKAQ